MYDRLVSIFLSAAVFHIVTLSLASCQNEPTYMKNVLPESLHSLQHALNSGTVADTPVIIQRSKRVTNSRYWERRSNDDKADAIVFPDSGENSIGSGSDEIQPRKSSLVESRSRYERIKSDERPLSRYSSRRRGKVYDRSGDEDYNGVNSRPSTQRRPAFQQPKKDDFSQPGRSSNRAKSFVPTGTVPYGYLYKWIKHYNAE